LNLFSGRPSRLALVAVLAVLCCLAALLASHPALAIISGD
jgi:hypothetical protein